MINFVNAKINIGLNVVSRREDGYHNLQSVFYPVGLYAGKPQNPESFCDILEIIDCSNISDSQCESGGSEIRKDGIIFRTSGEDIECDPERNLAYKAARLYFDSFVTDSFEVEIDLDKHLPSQAGMGGGSADAAFVLKMIRDLHADHIKSSWGESCLLSGLVPNDSKLARLALRLGADCPFFIFNTPSYVSGIGEKISPINLNLKGKWLVVVKPSVSISTAQAFAGIIPKEPDFDLQYITDLKIDDWKKFVKNDFEKPFFSSYPDMRDIKEGLYSSGALYASLTGSGSCIYGIYDDRETASRAKKSFHLFPTIQAVYLLEL